MKDIFIYYLLRIKLFFNNFLKFFKNKIITISEVKIVDSNNKISYVTLRFFLIKILVYFKLLIQNFINRLNIKLYTAHVIKNCLEGQKSIIKSSRKLDEKIRLLDLITLLDKFNDKKDTQIEKIIFMKFEIECPINGNIDFKEYLIKYRDNDKEFDHTIKNILIFNGLKVDEKASVKIKAFSSGNFINKNLKYEEVKNKHLNDFINLEGITTN
jgi:hypothetical protein